MKNWFTQQKVTKCALALGLAIVTIGSTAASAADTTNKEMTLMLDWFVNPNHGPIVIAQERGLFNDQA